jgi:hypothetical protein
MVNVSEHVNILRKSTLGRGNRKINKRELRCALAYTWENKRGLCGLRRVNKGRMGDEVSGQCIESHVKSCRTL